MKHYIHTPDAPGAVGAYSQGVVSRGLLFTAGQVALRPEGGLANSSVEGETHQVMANLRAILGAAGCSFVDVVQTRIYITDQELFPRVNTAYAEYFTEGQEPVRECVVAAPPLEGAHVEMSMIAETPYGVFTRLKGLRIQQILSRQRRNNVRNRGA